MSDAMIILSFLPLLRSEHAFRLSTCGQGGSGHISANTFRWCFRCCAEHVSQYAPPTTRGRPAYRTFIYQDCLISHRRWRSGNPLPNILNSKIRFYDSSTHCASSLFARPWFRNHPPAFLFFAPLVNDPPDLPSYTKLSHTPCEEWCSGIRT
jgi:hypothetical protein